jgi:hypothetical protein
VHSDGDVESLVKFHSPSARPTVCVMPLRGTLGRVGVGSGAEKNRSHAYAKCLKMATNPQSPVHAVLDSGF